MSHQGITLGFGHRSRSSAQTTNERTYDVLPNPDIFKKLSTDPPWPRAHAPAPLPRTRGLVRAPARGRRGKGLLTWGEILLWGRARSQLSASRPRRGSSRMPERSTATLPARRRRQTVRVGQEQLLAFNNATPDACGVSATHNAGGVGLRAFARLGTGVSALGAVGGAFEGTTAPLYLVPASAVGRPTSGTHAMGQFYVDAHGALYFCTASGSPGTGNKYNSHRACFQFGHQAVARPIPPSRFQENVLKRMVTVYGCFAPWRGSAP
jgi:hypothetical protein